MKGFLWSESTVRKLHIELSNNCNAACPFCPRYFLGTETVRPDLDLQQINLKKFTNWFRPDFIRNLSKVLLCGTHGDPATAKDIYEICEYILENNSSVSINIHTNGGLRNSGFWNSLGKLFKGTNCVVVFSIDGLEDTNHIYRRNVSWKKLIKNVSAYNETGARSNWEYLVFGHNEHQIDEARNLSKDLGFHEFSIKRALGFEEEGTVSHKPIYDKEGNLQRYIYPPNSDYYLNANTNYEYDYKDIPNKIDLSWLYTYDKNYNPTVEKNLETFDYASIPKWLQKIEKLEIECKSCIGSGSDSEIYVACDGIVYPCCYIGTEAYSDSITYDSLQLKKIIREYGLDYFNLNYHSLHTIIYDDKHLDSLYANSWHAEKFTSGMISFCSSTCGKNNLQDKIYINQDSV